ncbi:MAG: helix-turn-helix domain-containing protein [Gammaproteobacteria bacterium]
MADNHAHLPLLDPRQRYTIDEAARYLRVSRAYLYRLISSGEIRTIVDGRRRYVPGSAIAARCAAEE